MPKYPGTRLLGYSKMKHSHLNWLGVRAPGRSPDTRIRNYSGILLLWPNSKGWNCFEKKVDRERQSTTRGRLQRVLSDQLESAKTPLINKFPHMSEEICTKQFVVNWSAATTIFPICCRSGCSNGSQ